MSIASKLEEIRIMQFEEIYELRTEKRLTIEEATKLLGINERTFRRWCSKYQEEGAKGLHDHRLDKLAHNAAPIDEVMKMLQLFETQYADFSISRFYDKYRWEHRVTRSYSWIKKHLQRNGKVGISKKRWVHRKKRPRVPYKGLLIHQDGSTHQWVKQNKWDLIVTMDDADNEIYSAFFVLEEGTWSSFKGVKEVIACNGLFCSLYTGRGSHYWYTPEAGGKVDKNRLTQFGRAMKQLGIEMIPAYSPEARGQSERMFGTLQARLPKELKLAGITDMDKANQFIMEKYLPQHNKRFKLEIDTTETAFIPFREGNVNLNDILCVQEIRKVNKDNTVNYKGKNLQIPADNYRWSYSKAKVKVYEHMDRTISLFYGPRLLANYDDYGSLIV